MTDKFERCLVRETLDTFRDFVDSSDGLVGWHLNGDVATWGELDVTVDQVDEALAAWNTRTPTPAVEDDETPTNPVVSQNAPDLKHKPAAPQTGYSWTNSAPQGAPETIWEMHFYALKGRSAARIAELEAINLQQLGEIMGMSDQIATLEKAPAQFDFICKHCNNSALSEYVKEVDGIVATARNEALEEAANEFGEATTQAGEHIANSIRALKTPEGDG